jgi:hypothetical protein
MLNPKLAAAISCTPVRQFRREFDALGLAL